MEKADGAFLTIGELAQELGVAQHILRYWESRFPQLRPLQRAGNRRYYRPQDVEVAKRIHRLLNVEGFTIKGAAKALSDRNDRGDRSGAQSVAPSPATAPAAPMEKPVQAAPSVQAPSPRVSVEGLLDRLQLIRGELAKAIGEVVTD